MLWIIKTFSLIAVGYALASASKLKRYLISDSNWSHFTYVYLSLLALSALYCLLFLRPFRKMAKLEMEQSRRYYKPEAPTQPGLRITKNVLSP